MSEHQILLPDDVYSHLLAAAQAEGISPTEWIIAQLAKVAKPDLLETISDLIGAINSQDEPHQTYQKTDFGEGLAAKLAFQGIHRP